MGRLSRDKGARVEREVVNLHRKIDIQAERVPLSGGTHYQGNGEDVDIYLDGPDRAPLLTQVKAIKGHRGTKGITDSLGDADVLFLRFDAQPGQPAQAPLVVMPWQTWERLVKRGR
ncbi:MAG: hypothetical protein J2P48_08305 [Alphaproteobacteria bacterium]|nr:hypothetical protein [Alphaproteobacteria bacterium]